MDNVLYLSRCASNLCRYSLNIAVFCLVTCLVLHLNIAVEKSHVFQCVEAVILWRMFLRLQNPVSLCKADIRPMPLLRTLRIRNPNNAM